MDYRRRLLVAKALVREPARAWRPDDLGGEAGLGDFLRFALRQQMAATLHRALGPERLRRDFPAPFAAKLQAHADAQRVRHERLLDVLREIDALFRSAGIGFAALKGPVYAEELYGGRDARHWDDLDLLVRRRDRARAQAALETAGFEPAARGRWPAGIVARFDHAVQLCRDGLPVDLHWAIRNRPAYRIREDTVWSDLRRRPLAGLKTPVLSLEHSILAAILELAQDIERNNAKAKSLLDLYLLIRAADCLDWEAFLERRAAERLRGLCVNTIAVLLLGLDCAGEFPRLRRLVLEGDAAPVIGDRDLACRLLDPEDGALNRWWFAQVYPGSRLAYWSWLAAALVVSPGFPRNVPPLGRAWNRAILALRRRIPGSPARG